MTWRELSARIGVVLLLILLVDLADHAVQVVQDLLVHLDYAGLALALRDVEERERAAVLLAQLGQELRPSEEDGAGQAGFSELNDQGD
jgi:hypothetical protein